MASSKNASRKQPYINIFLQNTAIKSILLAFRRALESKFLNFKIALVFHLTH